MSAHEVPRVPDGVEGDDLERLLQARSTAVDFILTAEELERNARVARRTATTTLKAYEHLLEQYNGQLALEGLDDESALRR